MVVSPDVQRVDTDEGWRATLPAPRLAAEVKFLMRRLPLLLLVLILLPDFVHSQTTPQKSNGAELLRACRTALKFEDATSHLSMTDELEGGFCIGMVHGISSTLYLNRSIAAKQVTTVTGIGCVPGDVSNSEAVRVVVGYLEAHPERLHIPEAQLIIEALIQAFPCSSAAT